MGFFGTKKKKPENVKTLSETEIQQRLYGHLRVPSSKVEDPESHTARPSSFTVRRPLESSKDFSSKSQTVSETLKTPEVSTASKQAPAAGVTVKSSQPKSTWSDTSSAANAPVKSKKEIRKNPLAGVPGALLAFLKSVSFFLLTTLFKLTASIFRFFTSIDFRKPQVKRAASTLGAAAFVALLFLSTHFLNVGREAAMKSPHPKSASEVVRKKVPFAQSKRVEEVSQEAAVPAPKEDSQDIVSPDEPARGESKRKMETHPAGEETPAAPAGAKPKFVEHGAYSIQIATFAAREDAGRLVSKLRIQDADAFIRELERPGGRTYYCVFVGHYKSFLEAEESLSQFRKKPLAKPFLDAFARALKPE